MQRTRGGIGEFTWMLHLLGPVVRFQLACSAGATSETVVVS